MTFRLPRTLAAGLAGALLLQPSLARATACSGATNLCSICAPNICTVPNNPWSYELAQWIDANGQENTDFENQVHTAFGLWGTDPSAPGYSPVPCSALRTRESGMDTDPAAAVSGDGKNSIGVNVTQRGTQQYQYLSGGVGQSGTAVGLAVLEFGSGIVSECDVFFNSVDFQFGDLHNGNNGSQIDVETVANQETGHCFGLDHYLDDYQAVMYPYVSPGDERWQLEPHDINNICQLYPVQGAFGGPCSGSCNAGLSCITDPGNGSQYCSQGCTGTGQGSCSTGYRCMAVSSPNGNYCVAGSSTAGVPVGSACVGQTQCAAGGTAGQCIQQVFALPDGGTQTTPFYGGYCTATCTALPDGGVGSGDCPTGSACQPAPPGSSGAAANQSFCLKQCAGFFPNACGRTDAPYDCVPLNYSLVNQGAGIVFANFVCYPGCETNADCVVNGADSCSGNRCQLSGEPCTTSADCTLACFHGGCVYGKFNSSASPGSPCTVDADCPEGGMCWSEAQTGFPGGYCVTGMGEEANCGTDPSGICGPTGSCTVFDVHTNFGECFESCQKDADCRTGYNCYSISSTDGGSVCLPPAAVNGGGTSSSSSSSSSSGGTSGAVDGGSVGGATGAASTSGYGSSGVGSSGSSGVSGGVTSTSSGSGSGTSGGSGSTSATYGPAPRPRTGATGGCGCTTGAPAEEVLFAAWLFAALLRRRRQDPTPRRRRMAATRPSIV